MSTRQISERDLWAWTTLLAAILLILDMLTPPCVNFEVLYVALVFPSLWSTRRSFLYFVAVSASCLTMWGALDAAADRR